MSNLTYFLWIEDSSLDISPDEEMVAYLSENCPLPTDEELERLEREVNQWNQSHRQST